MSERSKALLVGLVLGDGYLSKPNGKSKKSYLDLKYDEKSLGYLRWIRTELSELNPSPIRRKKNYHQYRFYTESREDVGIIRKIFYPNGRKIIPRNIRKFLCNPLTLAIWYQDDGTLDFRDKYHANAMLSTYCFTKDECQLLASAMHDIYNLDVRVCRCVMRGILYFRLYIASKSMEMFMRLIEPYMHRCFQYKLVKNRIV